MPLLVVCGRCCSGRELTGKLWYPSSMQIIIQDEHDNIPPFFSSLLTAGVEDGQTVRMPVGKKEIFITFRVRILTALFHS